MIAGLIKRIVVWGVSTVVALGLAFAATYVQGIPIREAQAQTATLLGENLELCAKENLKTMSRSSVSLKGQIGVVDVEHKRIYKQYQDALDTERQPTEATKLVGILCLREKIETNTEEYGSNSSSKRYYCTQYAHDLEAFLFDTQTKKMVAYRKFQGTQPPECPDRTSSSVTKHGQLPPSSDIGDWIK